MCRLSDRFRKSFYAIKGRILDVVDLAYPSMGNAIAFGQPLFLFFRSPRPLVKHIEGEFFLFNQVQIAPNPRIIHARHSIDY